MNDNNLTKKFRYPFVAILFTFLAILAFSITPTDIISGLAFAVSVGVGILFSYKTIQYKKFSDRLIGIICLIITGSLAVITVFGYLFDWNIF